MFSIRTCTYHGMMWGAASLLVVLTFAGPSMAGANAAAAEKLFREAVSLASNGKFDAAVAKFQASYELDPARGTLFGLALAEEKAGRLASALGHFQELRQLADRAGDSQRKKSASEHIEKLQAVVPTVKLVVSQQGLPGLRVVFDGQELPHGAWDTDLPVDPGSHTVSATASGYEKFAQTMQIARGAHETIVVRVSPATPGSGSHGSSSNNQVQFHDNDGTSASSTTNTLSIAGYVTAGVGLVGLGVGTAMLLKSDSLYRDTQTACPDNICTSDRADDIDRGKSLQSWGTGMLVTGGVLTAAGVTMVLWPHSHGDDAASSPRVSVTPTGLVLHGTF